jgi:hypothetical protein
MRSVLFAITAALLLAKPALAAAPDWSGLSWLFGRWVAVGGGAEQGSGGFSFEPEAGGEVVVRSNRADYPARDGRPGGHHEYLMVIWRDAPSTASRSPPPRQREERGRGGPPIGKARAT